MCRPCCIQSGRVAFSIFLIMFIRASPQSTSGNSESQLIATSLDLTGLQANSSSTWIANLVTSLCTHCAVVLTVLAVCIFPRPFAKCPRPRAVLPPCSSFEGVPAAKSTPRFSFNLAPPMTKCATIPVDNNLSTDLPFAIVSIDEHSSLVTLHTTTSCSSPNLQPNSSFFPPVPFTNHNTLSTTNTRTTTYNRFTSSSNPHLPLPTTPTPNTLDTMAPRKNTKSASTPAPVAASKVAKVPAGRKNTKSTSNPAAVAASETAKVPAARKNTKSATTPAPVADSDTTKVYAGRKTRAMIAAEEKAAAETGTATVSATVAPVKAVKPVKPAATKAKTAETGTAAVNATVAPVKAVKTVKPAVNATVAPTKAVKTVKPAVNATVAPTKAVKTEKPAVTKAKSVEPAVTKAAVKGTTLKSAASALKALKAASKTHQAETEDPIPEVATSTLKQLAATTKPSTVTPAADPVSTKPTSTLKQPTAITEHATVTPAVADPVRTKPTSKTMSMTQAAEFMRVFRCSKPSAESPVGKALVTPVVTEPVVEEPAVAVPPTEDVEDTTPVETVHPPQADVDKDLLAWLLAHKKKGAPWGTQCVAVGPESMARDFQRMGFRKNKREELLAMKEPVLVDGLTQRPADERFIVGCVPGTGPEPPKPAKMAPKYQQLVIFEDKGASISLPPHTSTRLHLLTYITRLGSIRSSQGLPYQGSRRAALLHHQMGHFRPWQRSHPSDEHENELAVHHIASHASEPPQLHRRLHNVRSQDRWLEAHPEPQQEGLGSPARLQTSSPRPWRQAQRHPCRRPSGTTTSPSRFEEAQGHRDPGCRATSSSLRAG
jgi:hypothetical protein